MSAPGSAAELLQALVRIPSVNPEGDPGTDRTGERACAEFVGAELTALGAAEVRYDEVLPGRPNVVARFPSDQPGKPVLLLAPHTDTVSVRGMTVDPFGGELRDGRIWGRGATDTKGTMAAMLWAIRQLGPRIAGLGHEIWFAGLMGEEAGQHGSRHLADRFRPAFVVVGEPTELNIVHAHKGCTWMSVTTRGKAVHASTPGRGANAIYGMANVIEWLRDELAPAFARIPDATLGSPTVSVGTIRGGSKTNIVPDQCTIEVDLRTVPAQDRDKLETMLSDGIACAAPGSEIRFSHATALSTDPTHPLIGLLAAAGGGQPVGAPWFCDAASFGAHGIPAVAAGPGSIAQAHTVDEWLSVDDLEAGVDFYRRFLESV
jgi:acetylornithine deacetylase/succinyl-diaminopimelate desuccinylase-like protein